MPITSKLVAVAASGLVLVGGATATVVSANAAPAPTTVATPAAVSTTEVRVWADGTAHVVSVPQPSVAAALTAANVNLGPDDRVSLPLEEVLSPGESVSVTRVTVTQWTKDVTLAFTTTEEKDATLEKGKRKVKAEGSEGHRQETVRTVTVDGSIESQDVVASTVTAEPVARVVLVGTREEPKVDSRSTQRTPAPKASASAKPTTAAKASAPAASSGAGLNTANAAMWDRIAKCESGGNWAINTGNGYYGGLQFNVGTWRSVGGTDFAAYPHQASREQQITVANRLYAQRGLQPWGCAHAA